MPAGSSRFWMCSGSAGKGEGVPPLRSRSERRKKQRKHDTPKEKVVVLRRHLLDQEPVSKWCDERGLKPTVLYRWQKEFFENEAAVFQPRGLADDSAKQKRIAYLEQRSRPRTRFWPSGWRSTSR